MSELYSKYKLFMIYCTLLIVLLLTRLQGFDCDFCLMICSWRMVDVSLVYKCYKDDPFIQTYTDDMTISYFTTYIGIHTSFKVLLVLHHLYISGMYCTTVIMHLQVCIPSKWMRLQVCIPSKWQCTNAAPWMQHT